ncbi:ABC transporter permease [Paraflavitalea soli]|uniref:ABC transporter permease n=1 Tax=Paraflavitalea soli TaxID=2315862 RepID=A0A3B7MJW6_9BACT|nr:ABC transporter permease [Paraflavitalea soli]AXY73927.1 ABC transporter permease [Paraflavitalea soli]
MITTWFKIAWRTLTRHKIYSLINVLGLTLGICACLVIWLITQYEFSFDKFHPDSDRIYRITTAQQFVKGESPSLTPAVIPPLAEAVRTGIPGLATVAPYHILADATVNVPVKDAVSAAFPSQPVVAGPAYFSILPPVWLAGDARTALSAPFKVVLSETKARQYFGPLSPDQVLGRELVYNDSLHVQVAGIIKDWKGHTDFPFTEFISLSTADHGFLQRSLHLDQLQWKGVPFSSRVLLKLAKDVKREDVDAALTALFNARWGTGTMTVALQPLNRVHFTDYGNGTQMRTAHLPTLYALISIALFILILAVINYVNLATAQSLTRDKEVGIRKVLGSSRTSIVIQFLCETLVLTLLSVLLAALLVKPVLGLFQRFIPAAVSFDPFAVNTWLFLAGIALLTTLLAGLYPARFLSSYLPVITLKGAGAVRGSEKWWLRKGLIVFQFTISLLFIIGTLVIGRQIRFMLTKDLGFKSDAVVLFSTNESRDSLNRVKLLEEQIRQLPGVAGAARENMPPMGLDRGVFTIQYKALGEDKIPVAAVKADEHFIPFYQIRLLAGRNLLPSDTLKELVINESLARLLGFKKPAQALGQSLYTWNKFVPIVGVVADFHQASLHEPVKPMVIAAIACTDMAVRLDTKNMPAAHTRAILARIERRWKEFYPNTPFEYEFLDESLAQLYEKEQTTAWLMNIATGITIFISCIGLLGLTMFTAERRTREIGIRKVLGASVPDIVALLGKDFILLVIIALVIASPIAWLFMQQWLQDFAYRIPVGWDIFLVAGMAILGITFLTIGFQSLKAALANPVKSLRTE